MFQREGLSCNFECITIIFNAQALFQSPAASRERCSALLYYQAERKARSRLNTLKSLYLVISWRFIGNISKFRDHYACQLHNNERCQLMLIDVRNESKNRTEGRKKSKIESRAAKSPK